MAFPAVGGAGQKQGQNKQALKYIMGKKKRASSSRPAAKAHSLSSHVSRLTSQTPPARINNESRPLPTPSLPSSPPLLPPDDANVPSYMKKTGPSLLGTDAIVNPSPSNVTQTATTTQNPRSKNNLSPLSTLTKREVAEHLVNPRGQFAFLEDIRRYRSEKAKKKFLEGEVVKTGPR